LTGWWRAEPGGATVRVKVQPKARRAGLGGVVPGSGGPAADGPRLRVAVTEAPEDGLATRAACEALAKALGVPASAVQLVQGAAAREKTLAVAGDPATLGPKLEALG
jgi:uncharacterized protein YggU (UPF0235/DUF167 family)